MIDLYSIKVIKELLRANNTIPNSLLGQNFLLEKRVAAKILKAAEISPKDTVLEIGPGIGTLTKELAQKAKRVVSVEKDPAMVKILRETLRGFKNIEVTQGDILKSNLDKLLSGEYRVVANLPYYITSPVIRMFLETQHKPELMVFMVQKEVAQRICAKPKDMNLLAVSVQFYAEPKIVSFVSKGAFWPRPKVDSAILKLIPKRESPFVNPNLFFRIVKAGFKQPRKQLGNNLTQGLKLSKEEATAWLKQVGIQPTQRAETLSVTNWISLARSLSKISA